MRQAPSPPSRPRLLRRMPSIPLRSWLVLLLVLFGVAAIAVAGCTASAKSGDPDLSGAFPDADIPAVAINAYLYVDPETVVGLPYRALGYEGNGDAAADLQWLEAVVNQPGEAYGVTLRFAGEHEAGQARDLLRGGEDGRVVRTVDVAGPRTTLTVGAGEWSGQLRQAWTANDRVPLKERYPDIYEAMRFLPREAPATPVAVGFVRNAAAMMEALLAQRDASIPGLGSALGLVRVRSMAFAAYADGMDVLPTELTAEEVESADLGIIAVARAGYPGFIINLLLGNFVGRLGLEGMDLGDTGIRYREVGDRFHLMVKNYGKTLFFALAPTHQGAQRLMESVIANQT